jgi:hypothetical protein
VCGYVSGYMADIRTDIGLDRIVPRHLCAAELEMTCNKSRFEVVASVLNTWLCAGPLMASHT